jgi:uncharacterized protein (TIGR02996 family)
MDESAFLAAIDDGDDDTLTVYADWLQDNGDDARAEFLRAQEATRRMTHRRRAFLESARRAILLGSTLPLGWLARVSRPRLPGTVWAGTDSDGGYYIWRFATGGAVDYSSGTGDFKTASWRQIGPLVMIQTNFHYATYEGLAAGRALRGWAANVVERDWAWEWRLTTEKAARAAAPYRSRWRSRRRRR